MTNEDQDEVTTSHNTLDLIQTLYELCTQKREKTNPFLTEAVGESDHYIVFLIDGFGTRFFLETLPNTFLKKRDYLNLHSLFPSSTSAVLTSITTLKYPADHGVFSWWTYVPEFDLQVIPLLFRERFTHKLLNKKRFNPNLLFKIESVYKHFGRKVYTFLPHSYLHSQFTKYSMEGTSKIGYKNIEDAFLKLEDLFSNNLKEKSYTYVYFSDLDHLIHQEGTKSKSGQELFLTFSKHFEDLRKKVVDQVRFIVTSDHGLLDIKEKNHFFFDHRFLKYLKSPPHGEARTAMFRVKEDLKDEFVASFIERYGEYFELLSREEVLRRELLGPKMSETSKERLGDFLALPQGPYALEYLETTMQEKHMKALHGALSDEETQIPCILF